MYEWTNIELGIAISMKIIVMPPSSAERDHRDEYELKEIVENGNKFFFLV